MMISDSGLLFGGHPVGLSFRIKYSTREITRDDSQLSVAGDAQ